MSSVLTVRPTRPPRPRLRVARFAFESLPPPLSHQVVSVLYPSQPPCFCFHAHIVSSLSSVACIPPFCTTSLPPSNNESPGGKGVFRTRTRRCDTPNSYQNVLRFKRLPMAETGHLRDVNRRSRTRYRNGIAERSASSQSRLDYSGGHSAKI